MKYLPFSGPRRRLLKALAGAAVSPALIAPGQAQTLPARRAGSPIILRLAPQSLYLHASGLATPVWQLGDGLSSTRITSADPPRITVTNGTPFPGAVVLHGLDGTARAEPLLAQPPLRPGASVTFDLPAQPGTFLIDPRLLPSDSDRPAIPRVLVIEGGETFEADHEEILLIEDWKIGADGKAQIAGRDGPDMPSLYTINRRITYDVTVRPNERVRLRLVSGCQRLVVALKFTDCVMSIVAIDGQPAEPFVARDGQIVLAPGSRVDALLDATQPVGTQTEILLHDGIKPMPVGRVVTTFSAPGRAAPLPPPAAPTPPPSKIDLKNAQRIDLSLDAGQWLPASAFAAALPPAFRTATNKTVVLAITNPAATAATFHLHGHHFRLLDRLDDGWKPYWLDTLAFNPGQTQRIAFNAAFPGKWLMQCMSTAWSSPRRLRWYEVG
jgi:FtsP/CotA-like multicopper oxidase with cupredoxin domain